jgi:hypothetical protein
VSRRVVAPVLLLVAAALSVAAVFAVHRIEARGGPLSQPSATTFFSPDGDGVQDEAEVRFTTRQSERITIDVVDQGTGDRVARVLDDERVDGERIVTWDGAGDDGTRLRDGEYRFVIRRAGDARRYSPTTTTTIDTREPIGILDRATLELGELRGLAMLGPGEQLEVFRRGDAVRPVDGIRQFSPNPDSAGAIPGRRAPANTKPVRFTVALEGTPERIDIVDKAGNRRQVFPDTAVDYEANG